MKLRRAAFSVAVAAVASIGASATPDAVTSGVCAQQIAELDQRFDRLVQQQQLRGATLIVVDRGGTIYSRSSGEITADAPVPIASATKWLSAAAIVTLTDEGRLSLDSRLGAVLPMAPAPLSDATLRQLLSHTAGMSGAAIETIDEVRSMDDAVAKLLALQPPGKPGAFFAYGGASMQLAGAMAEKVAAKPWPIVFDERIAHPLGITTARWGWLRQNGSPDVPLVAGGLTLSGNDYAKFLGMLLRGGLAPDGSRVLSERAIADIETEQTGSAPVRFAPRAMGPNWRYGLGVWCEEPGAGGGCKVTSSAGAFGTYPWIDRQRGIAGVFVTMAALPKVLPGIIELRETAARLPRR